MVGISGKPNISIPPSTRSEVPKFCVRSCYNVDRQALRSSDEMDSDSNLLHV